MKTLESISRFDLEQEIMKCWNVTEDIDKLYEAVGECGLDQDEVLNYLLGLKTIYEVKFNKLFNTFEQCIKNGQI
jgi:Tat protein secretion system quality control protein TatD with DNase activity